MICRPIAISTPAESGMLFHPIGISTSIEDNTSAIKEKISKNVNYLCTNDYISVFHSTIEKVTDIFSLSLTQFKMDINKIIILIIFFILITYSFC